ncbi:Gfo/Idh/MocA family oxidoreductase [Bacillus timonensis]|uniref:Gfo/Idh/MocA family oxidoreductase n=1 Tax=Bacillus timonensis TaxID=1033734 RepID=UPI000289D129|nr:Gfo/Idh/MocA family oxidoreductase [Bacillus timonensis]
MRFSIIGCQHAHITIFIEEMLALGHSCAGIYEKENTTLAGMISASYTIPIVQSVEEILLDSSIEIVGCAAINNEKIDVLEICERHGKHVMLDKPAVTNRKDLGRLKALFSRGRIQVGMLLTERFRSSLYTLQKQISEGSLGRIVSITMRKPHLLNGKNRPSWHFF